MKSTEERLANIEAMITEIYATTVMGKKPLPPGAAEYKRAVEAMVRGDKEPLAEYMRKGGQILENGIIFPEADVQRGRKANLPTSAPARRTRQIEKGIPGGSSGPVALPEKGRRHMVQ